MRTKIITAVVIVLFASLAIYSYTSQQNKLHIQQVEYKSKETKLKSLDLKYNKLNTELDKLKSDKNASDEQVKKLVEQRQQLEKEKEQLQADLQAKKEAESKIAMASKNVVNAVTHTQTASAASGNQCSLVNNYSWDKRTAYAVCMAESGGDANAANMNDNHGTCRGSFGLMQLACFWIPNPTDPNANMAKAYEIYTRSGWQPWGAWSSGAYLKYMH